MFLWLALATLLTEGMVRVPPSGWQGMSVQVPPGRNTLAVDFSVRAGSRVQVLLLDREQASRFERGRSFHAMYSTGFNDEGRFRYSVPETGGEYVLMVDNRIDARGPAMVKIRAELIGRPERPVRELSPERRRLVVAMSIAFFGATVVLSAWLILRNIRAH